MATRRFFQIHLSTAIVLMFVAGVLVWANVVPRIINKGMGIVEYKQTGWPFVFKFESNSAREMYGELTHNTVWSADRVLWDILIAFWILLSVGAACEWFIRRRAAREADV